MRYDQVILISAGDMSLASVASNGIDLQQMVNASIQAVYTGAPVGSLAIEVSNDNVSPSQAGNPSANVVNWTSFGTPTSISAAGNSAVNLPDLTFRWMRVKYTKTSGTGSLSVVFFGKGA